jgi:putative tryptophan/tyrosine transport system substrate-binding protein
VAILNSGTPANFRSRGEAFVRAMAEMGYVEGRNVLYTWRSANGQADLLRQYANELKQGVDLIVSASTTSTHALQEAQVRLPIVMVTIDDPVALGFARSLAHPGSNITGVTADAVEQAARFIELLAQAAGKLARVAVLANPGSANYRAYRTRIEAAAARSGTHLMVIDATSPQEIDLEFPSHGPEGCDGAIVTSDVLFYSERMRLAELASGARLPAIYPQRAYVEVGGLMSYGPSPEQAYRRIAIYVDRIIKGASPRDMAIEPPNRYELVINRATARSLRLTLAPDLLKKADKVIG